MYSSLTMEDTDRKNLYNLIKEEEEEVYIHSKETFNKLSNEWCLYAHLPHDTKWTLDSYKEILKFSNVEQAISLYESMPSILIKNCMLFLMKDNITPVWEDPQNRNGGCYSFKVHNNNVYQAWMNLSYSIIGNTLSKNADFMKKINGASISPKRNFCIIKIWMKDCSYKSTNEIENIPNLDNKSVLFKPHKIEY